MAIQAINPQVQMPKTESKQNVNFNGILESKAFEKVAEFAGKNPATFNAASSLIMAGVLRPAAIMALPAKDEQEQKNKGIAAAHAIASGVIGFAITSVVMAPISKGLGKIFKAEGGVQKHLPKLTESMGKLPKEPAETLCKNVDKLMNFGPDIILAVPRALLTSKLSHVVQDALFGKKKKGEAVAQAPAQAQPTQSGRPVLDGFKGGNK